QSAVAAQQAHEFRINGRNAAEHQGQLRGAFADRGGGAADHVREQAPVRIHGEVPMGQVVWFVPELYRFDHSVSILLMPGSSLPALATPRAASVAPLLRLVQLGLMNASVSR